VTSRASLTPRLEAAADHGGFITFLGSAAGGDSAAADDRVEYARLLDDARAMAAGLQARGVAPGSHVAILGPTTRALVTAIEATWLAGAAAVVLPLPLRLASVEEFVAQTRARMLSSDAVLVVADAALAAFLDPQPGDPPIALLDEVVAGAGRPGSGAFERPADDPEALAILQYTSGSTSDPKGVMLPHRCITSNVDAVAAVIALDPDEDVAVSWLPLYHDLGLIGVLTLCLTSGADLALAAPQDFLASPGRWMEWMSAFGGTCTAGPHFSYVLAARALRRAGGLDLSRWRIALNGAEPIDPVGVAAFAETAAGHGFDPAAVYPAFGMAESTVAVAFPEPGSGLRTDTVDRRVIETDSYAAECDPGRREARSLVFLGGAVSGLELRICDPASGTVMKDREVGELEIRGTSITPGYYRSPETTAAAFHDEWLRSGDLGYLVDGDLVICGRLKDVMILGGRNVHPQDVERAASDVDGVRAGNVIAFGTEGRKGRETLVVVAESKVADRSIGIRAAVAARVRDTVGLTPEEIVLVRPGTLPKTSSGKLQRSLCRTRYLSADLEPV